LIKKFLNNHKVETKYRADFNRRALEWKKDKSKMNESLVLNMFPPKLFDNPLFKEGRACLFNTIYFIDFAFFLKYKFPEIMKMNK